jgi:uncharacterized tellurite resistance protein B-like protein
VDIGDEKVRRRLCELIAGILVADDDLDPAEHDFIERVYARFELPAEARRRLFPIVDAGDAAAALRALPESARVYALRMLVEAAAADGKVVPRERRYLETAAEALGIAPEELEARIAAELTSIT